MIKLKDSLKIAKIKFKTRKIRNAFSGCAISLGIILILVILFGTTGLISTASKIFKDTNANRYFAEGYAYSSNESIYYDAIQTKPSFDDYQPPKSITKEEYIKKYPSYKFKNVYDKSLAVSGQFTFEGKAPSTNHENIFMGSSGSYNLVSLDSLFVSDYVYGDYKFDDKYGDKIPLIVPKDYILSLDLKDISQLTNKEKYKKTKEVLDKYIGKEIKLETSTFTAPESGQMEPKIETKVLKTKFIIAGFSTATPFGYNSIDNSFLIPNWSATKNDELKEYFPTTSSKSYILEFENKSERDKFVKEAQKQMDYSVSPILGKFEMFTEPLQIIRKVGFALGGFLLFISALFILTTLAKIVADSRKEIGVFRAIGAQKSDIKKIFFSFSFLLTTFGFLLGLIISIIFNSILSLIYGDKIFYSIVNFGTNMNFSEPFLILVKIPIIELVLVYIFTLLIGFLASYLPIRKASRIDPIKALREE